jgi:hypothetical protein
MKMALIKIVKSKAASMKFPATSHKIVYLNSISAYDIVKVEVDGDEKTLCC